MLHYIDPLIPHELYPTLIYHAAMGEVPSLIHFNGADKVYSACEWWGGSGGTICSMTYLGTMYPVN